MSGRRSGEVRPPGADGGPLPFGALPPPGIEIRPATPADRPFLRLVDQWATDASPTLLRQVHRPTWDAHLDAFWASTPRVDALVAWEGAYPVGGVYLSSQPDEGSRVLRLVIAVAPTHRRRGIGKALLSAAARHARDRGYETLILTVDPLNEPAHALYRAAGFVERGSTLGLVDMRLDLSAPGGHG